MQYMTIAQNRVSCSGSRRYEPSGLPTSLGPGLVRLVFVHQDASSLNDVTLALPSDCEARAAAGSDLVLNAMGAALAAV